MRVVQQMHTVVTFYFLLLYQRMQKHELRLYNKLHRRTMNLIRQYENLGTQHAPFTPTQWNRYVNLNRQLREANQRTRQFLKRLSNKYLGPQPNLYPVSQLIGRARRNLAARTIQSRWRGNNRIGLPIITPPAYSLMPGRSVLRRLPQ